MTAVPRAAVGKAGFFERVFVVFVVEDEDAACPPLFRFVIVELAPAAALAATPLAREAVDETEADRLERIDALAEEG